MHDILLDNPDPKIQDHLTNHSPLLFRVGANEDIDRFYKHVIDAAHYTSNLQHLQSYHSL